MTGEPRDRTWGAVVPVRLDAVEHVENARWVLEGLDAAGADEIWLVEQRGIGGFATQDLGFPSSVRREVIASTREAFERARLVNHVVERMQTDWVWICDPNLLLPFAELGRRLRRGRHVAMQLVGEIESLGEVESARVRAGSQPAPGKARAAPFGKASFAVDRDVLIAIGGLSEAFVGGADEGFELVRRLKRFFSDFSSVEARGLALWAPRREVDQAARTDNKRLQERLAERIDADVDGYLVSRLETRLAVDLERLRRLSRDRGREAAFRVTAPTPPPRLPAKLSGSLWGVTALFNPEGYRSKRENFALFREGLRRAGLPLLAVELAFGDAAFALREGDADRLIQMRGGDVLWQKERLLNVGIAALPDDCDKVVWLDADILFERADWARRTAELLEEVAVVQPFSRSIRLLPGERTAAIDDLPVGSGEHEVLHGMAFGVSAKGHGCLGRYLDHGHCGYAWAARRALLLRHGLYDANILGNGDLNVAHAMFGGARYLKTERLGEKARRHLARWAEAFFADVRASAGHVDGTVFHLWHGDKEDRRYIDRLDALVEHDYDPELDLAIDEQGAYRWASDKSALHALCRSYFAARKEDGNDPTRGNDPTTRPQRQRPDPGWTTTNDPTTQRPDPGWTTTRRRRPDPG